MLEITVLKRLIFIISVMNSRNVYFSYIAEFYPVNTGLLSFDSVTIIVSRIIGPLEWTANTRTNEVLFKRRIFYPKLVILIKNWVLQKFDQLCLNKPDY